MRGILLLLIILTPLLNFSQENKNPTYTISGKIIDAISKKPLEYATVVFKNLDSDQIKFGCITNHRGNFSIVIEEGAYNATVEYIAYKTKKINISTVNRDFNIGTILLELDTEYLDIIEITAEKRALEFKPNKLVFNVERDISAAGSMAIDILNNIPSVSVDPDGNISLRGQDNITIMIDGRISLLTKYEALKSLPAGSIEKIEVITNPGAKYKATSFGIINIILKKGKNHGLNASITATGGYKDYYGGLLTLNNKSNQMNFFTTASYFHRNPVRLANSENEYFNNNNSSIFLNEYSENNNKADVFYSTIGADFYLSDRSTLTATINYQNIDNIGNSTTETDFFDASKRLIESNNRSHLEKFDDEIVEFIIDFEHHFKKEKQVLTSSITYSKDDETYVNNIDNTNEGFTNEDYSIKNTLKSTFFDIQFSNSFNEISNYTIGYNGEFGKIPFSYSNVSNNNDINYSEDIHAVFVTYDHEGEKIYYELGLRAEFAESKIDYINLNTSQKKQYNDLFPSVYLEYNFNDSKNIYLNFSKKIQRPTYDKLQPYEQKISETSSYIGNEKLDPVYADLINLAYTYSGDKIIFAPSFFFNRYTGYWQDVTYETGEQVNGVIKIITTPVNIGTVNYYGVNLSTILKASKSLNFTGNILLANFDQSGTFETINTANTTIIKDYNYTSLNGSISLLTQLKIPNVFDFQTNIKHHLISKGAFSTRKAYTYASAAIYKDIFHKNASISLTVDDLFKSNKTNRDRFDDAYFSKSILENKYRTVLLSFTYRFNQSKKDRKIDFDKKDVKPNY